MLKELAATGIVGIGGIGFGLWLICKGRKWFRLEDSSADKKDARSTVLSLRAASSLIFAGIALLLLSFAYLWTMDLVRAVIN